MRYNVSHPQSNPMFQGEPGSDGAPGIPGIPGEDGAVGPKVGSLKLAMICVEILEKVLFSSQMPSDKQFP